MYKHVQIEIAVVPYTDLPRGLTEIFRHFSYYLSHENMKGSPLSSEYIILFDVLYASLCYIRTRTRELSLLPELMKVLVIKYFVENKCHI